MRNRVQALAKIQFLKIKEGDVTPADEKEPDPMGYTKQSQGMSAWCPGPLLVSTGSRTDPGWAQPGDGPPG